MYNSLKGKNLIRVPGQHRCMKFEPVSSGRESTIASSEESELNAIANAKRKGLPLYFIRSSYGTTLDVLLDRPTAIRTRDEMRDRIHNGRPNIQAYEQVGQTLTRL